MQTSFTELPNTTTRPPLANNLLPSPSQTHITCTFSLYTISLDNQPNRILTASTPDWLLPFFPGIYIYMLILTNKNIGNYLLMGTLKLVTCFPSSSQPQRTYTKVKHNNWSNHKWKSDSPFMTHVTLWWKRIRNKSSWMISLSSSQQANIFWPAISQSLKPKYDLSLRGQLVTLGSQQGRLQLLQLHPRSPDLSPSNTQ